MIVSFSFWRPGKHTHTSAQSFNRQSMRI
jgi:hypothetical protein